MRDYFDDEVTTSFSSYTSIPTQVAKYPISARAKGIYLTGCYLVDLRRSFPDNPALKVTKQKIFEHCAEGKAAFDTAWNELKEEGFLEVIKTNTSKHFTYRYRFLDNPIKNNEKSKKSNEQQNDTPKPNKPTPDSPSTYYEAKYVDVVEFVNKRICYTSWQNKTLDDVITDENDRFEPENSDIYVRDIVEDIRNIIVSVLMKNSPYIYIGKDKHNANEVKSMLNKISNVHISFIINSLYINDFFSGQLEIVNMQAYLLKTIYNSILTYNSTHLMNMVMEQQGNY